LDGNDDPKFLLIWKGIIFQQNFINLEGYHIPISDYATS